MSSQGRKSGGTKPPSSLAGQKRKVEAFQVLPSSKRLQQEDDRPVKFVRARGPWIAAQETREISYRAQLVSVDDEENGIYSCGLLIRGLDREPWCGTCEVPAKEMHPRVARAFRRFREEKSAVEDEHEDDEVIVVRQSTLRLSTIAHEGQPLQVFGQVTIDDVLEPLEDHPEIFACSLSFRNDEEGICWKGHCQIPKDEIQEWKLVDWEGGINGLLTTEVYDLDTLAELARLDTMHTVIFHGTLARNAGMQVDLCRRDGEDWEQRWAEIVEMRKVGDTLSLRLRFEMAPSTFMYLYGTMHAEMKHGRFAEETPGKVRSR